MKSNFAICLTFEYVIAAVLILGIKCSTLGLISPIEVVEEWGCHDTEIRLTCGHLDSKLAILEATFTPNCTNDDDCFSLGIKRLTGGLPTSQSTFRNIADPVAIETEAARKFLETLRKSHKNDEKADENVYTGNDEGSETDDEQTLSSSGNNNDEDKETIPFDDTTDPQADTLISNKRKRTSLRASLERLIERYLRKLSPNQDGHDCDLVKRSVRRTKRSPERTSESELSHSDGSQRIVIGARNITINETTSHTDGAEDSKEMYRRVHESKLFCAEQKHRISSLDRFHIEHSYKNESKDEINIRKILNHRCSGKNHCSFIFALDHPYSKVWDSGIVRIKYICMEDFRINRYCNEHLIIGHEIDPKTRFIHPTKGEPVAEARIQLNEQSFHSLKILKSGDEAESLPGFGGSSSSSNSHQVSDSRKRKIKIETPSEQEQKRKQAQGVYSQDFKVLKILPSNIDDFNDIERIGDEIYIRTDGDILNVPEAELGLKQRSELVPVPTALTIPILPHHIPKYDDESNGMQEEENILPIIPTTGYKNVVSQEVADHKKQRIPIAAVGNNNNDDIDSLPNSNQDFSKFENITLLIREGEEYVVKFPNQPIRILDNLAVNASSASTSATTTTTITATAAEVFSTASSAVSSVTSTKILSIFETDEKHKNATTMPSMQTVRDIAPAPTISEMGLSDLSAEASNSNYKSSNENEDMRLHNGFYDEDNDDENDDENDDIGDDFVEMDSGEEDEGKGYRGRNDDNRITYTSIQRISYRRPLLHGFSMTPGYPKFYVGDWECKSVISAPIGQRIRVTILDISIRYDEECKDFLRIVDLEYGHTLFNSCSEAIRPIEIVSESNQVEVIMKSTSKFAFPKRGVLIHYSALGCVDLPPPINGNLIKRTEKTAIYECEPSFVFPDSAVSKRQLLCTERHTWDKILPDCIEELAVIGSGIISGLNLNSYNKRPSIQVSPYYHHPAKMPNGAENQTSIEKDANMVTDVIVPLIIIGALFIINGFVFYYIRLQRKRQSSQQTESRELAEL